jgi:hypothetical protein
MMAAKPRSLFQEGLHAALAAGKAARRLTLKSANRILQQGSKGAQAQRPPAGSL